MEYNPAFDTAVEFVNNTSRSVFLTGKAGTGKTTFLRYIKDHTAKRCVIVAPTGVAAINAGGVTMHSFFQLPLGPYVPVTQRSGSASVTDKHILFKNIRFSEEKRQLLRDLELLIIDEVSMVRSDALDAIDAILRYFRKKPGLPFGGVQVLYIGDLFQLPPVMPEAEWSILKDYYQSPFFFHAKAVEHARPVYIELSRIYRQNEQRFIQILNRIRNNEAGDDDLEVLNAHYRKPPEAGKHYVTLTSHNHKADRINQEELRKLPGKLYEFKGTVEGDFSDKALPTEITLQLKEGAQVMFIRNDKSEERKYFNGKIVTVKSIDNDGIVVSLNDSGETLLLEKETWNNIRYSYNPAEEKVDEEKLGSFSQYPIRLAWAITIHKSQGLTFTHAIIDAGESFAPGQVYVALSRCVSLEGMILLSKIDRKSISTHHEVLQFSKATDESDLVKILTNEKHVFLNAALTQTFDLQRLIESVESHGAYIHKKKIPDIAAALLTVSAMLASLNDQQTIASRFRAQLEALLRENNSEKLRERVLKAIGYFTKALDEGVLRPLDGHIESLKGVSQVKKYLKAARALKLEVVRKINAIQTVRYGDITLNPSAVLISTQADEKALQKKQKAEKGASLMDTLALFNAGNSPAQIAERRALAISTIEGHLALLVKSGDIAIGNLIGEAKLNRILGAIRETSNPSLTAVKIKVGDEASYGEIRAVFNHLEFLEKRREAAVNQS